MVNACADPDFFVREGGGGGKPNGEKTALIFLCLFWGFFLSKIFRGCGRGSNYLRGGGGRGGVQMRISIEFGRTCDLPGKGSGPPPPPSSGSAHA